MAERENCLAAPQSQILRVRGERDSPELAVRRFLILTLVACFVSGCGDASRMPRYAARGVVTYPDGSPVPTGGIVEFRLITTEIRPASARGHINEDGTFELSTYEPGDGAFEGTHQALVAPPPPRGPAEAFLPQPIDRKYGRFETSGLEFTVQRDTDKNNFHIQVDRERPRS